jgi:hypothetical protein
MAATKTYAVILSSTTNAAGSTTTSSSENVTTAYGASVTWQITNGSTAPTLPCSAQLKISGDGSTWELYQQESAGVAASTVYQGEFDLPDSVMYFEVVFTGNTGQSVTVAAQAEIVTGV